MAEIRYLVDKPTELSIVDRGMLTNSLLKKYESIFKIHSDNDVTIYCFGKDFGRVAVKVTGVSEVRMVSIYADKDRSDKIAKIKKTLESILGKNLIEGKPIN